ncbi:g4100 [Coccomyxa viridis]|uniref:G4100 protein n=1 Tax=Coccomyxa viridis TaxID=1274662 RepID=A0ABP1FS85_9CHLO
MTLREWYKAASTCKTSYNVPLKWAKLIRKHPLEAWAFILKRSEKAVGFEVNFDCTTKGLEQAELTRQYIPVPLPQPSRM